MSRYPKLTIVAATLVFAVASYSKAPASTPPGSTAACKDGSYSTAASKSGACSGHGGVKDWYAGAAAPAVVPAAKTTYAPPAMPAAGSGKGQVWVSKESKVYHCPSDKWYGKTKDGAYISESSAVAQGFHADHGKACQ